MDQLKHLIEVWTSYAQGLTGSIGALAFACTPLPCNTDSSPFAVPSTTAATDPSSDPKTSATLRQPRFLAFRSSGTSAVNTGDQVSVGVTFTVTPKSVRSASTEERT